MTLIFTLENKFNDRLNEKKKSGHRISIGFAGRPPMMVQFLKTKKPPAHPALFLPAGLDFYGCSTRC